MSEYKPTNFPPRHDTGMQTSDWDGGFSEIIDSTSLAPLPDSGAGDIGTTDWDCGGFPDTDALTYLIKHQPGLEDPYSAIEGE